MVRSAPRIHPALVAAAERLDRSGVPIAEINRRVGEVAWALGLARPSYEQTRVIVQRARTIGRQPSTGDVLLDLAFRTRPPDALGAHLAGALSPRRNR